MKRIVVMIALLTALCMAATAPAALAADGEGIPTEQETPAEGTGEDAAGGEDAFFGTYSENQIRYETEHRMLPYFFYSENAASFLDNLLAYRGEYLAWLVERNLSGREGYEPYFTEEEIDVAVQECAVSEGADVAFTVVRVKMPEPAGCPECGYVFLCYDPGFGNRMYFTLEQSIMTPWMLCGWDAENNHLNYGAADDEPGSLMNTVVGLYVNAMMSADRAA